MLFQAIDIWMGACTAFIFAALLEFTLTNYLWRKGHKGKMLGPDASLADGIGVAVAAATGAGTIGFDPVISSAAVAGAATAATGHNGSTGNEDEVPMVNVRQRQNADERHQLFANELNGNFASIDTVSFNTEIVRKNGQKRRRL